MKSYFKAISNTNLRGWLILSKPSPKVISHWRKNKKRSKKKKNRWRLRGMVTTTPRMKNQKQMGY